MIIDVDLLKENIRETKKDVFTLNEIMDLISKSVSQYIKEHPDLDAENLAMNYNILKSIFSDEDYLDEYYNLKEQETKNKIQNTKDNIENNDLVSNNINGSDNKWVIK